MQRIGFVGAGLMGQQMSRRLLAAGFPVMIWNRTPAKTEALLAAGAAWGDSPRALAEASDVVIVMVTDSAASEAVICGPQGVLEGAHSGLTLIDMGSVAPETSRAVAERARAEGGAHASRRQACDGRGAGIERSRLMVRDAGGGRGQARAERGTKAAGG